MVKVPTTPDPSPPEYVEKRTQFLHDYGALLSLWSEFELALEVKIARLVGMAPLDASIVLGSLSFGNKPSILYALLDERGLTAIIEKVRAVINHVRRNALVHGTTGGDPDDNTFAFFKREVGSSYRVSHLTFTEDSFNKHFEEFRVLYQEALIAMDLYHDDLEEYGREARLFEPTPPRSQGRPPREGNG